MTWNSHCSLCTNLGRAAHAVQTLAGPHQQQVTMLVALVVDRTGQADFTGLCCDGEETAGIDEEAVADCFLLEGHSRCDQEAGERQRQSSPLANCAVEQRYPV